MRALHFVALVATSGLVGGCSRSAPPPEAGTAVSAAVVASPAPGDTDVQRGTAIGVQFDNPMDPASSTGRFTVHMGDTNGVVIPGRMMWDSGYRRMKFTPDSMLAPGTMYTVYMRDGMMSRGAMMGGDSTAMGGMGGGQHPMAGSPMMFTHAMPGAMRTGAGMTWSFTTGR